MPKLLIDIKLDPVPGWGYTIEDFLEYFKSSRTGIPHYIKDVTVVPECPVVEHKSSRGEAFDAPAPDFSSESDDRSFPGADKDHRRGEDEPQVGANDPCFANTPHCQCKDREASKYLGQRCSACNGLL